MTDGVILSGGTGVDSGNVWQGGQSVVDGVIWPGEAGLGVEDLAWGGSGSLPQRLMTATMQREHVAYEPIWRRSVVTMASAPPAQAPATCAAAPAGASTSAAAQPAPAPAPGAAWVLVDLEDECFVHAVITRLNASFMR